MILEAESQPSIRDHESKSMAVVVCVPHWNENSTLFSWWRSDHYLRIEYAPFKLNDDISY